MITLTLDKRPVVINTAGQIKITRENALFSTSGDYTLDVSIPLSVLTNRLFFGPANRLDNEKEIKNYAAILSVNGVVLLNGSAKITAISSEDIKLQLYADRSEFNAVHGDKYIDELNLPHFPIINNGGFSGSRGTFIKVNGAYEIVENDVVLHASDAASDKFLFVPIFNETVGRVINIHSTCVHLNGERLPYRDKRSDFAQFNILYIIKCMFKAIGYDADLSEFDVQPYNRIYVANVIDKVLMSGFLPHWKFRDFLIHVQNFFGCTFIFSSEHLKVKMTRNTSTYAAHYIKITNEEYFEMNVEDEDIESEKTSSLHYDLSNSDFHDIDYIDEDKVSQLPCKSYDSHADLMRAYYSLADNEKDSYLFRCPQGDFCEWTFSDDADKDHSIHSLYHVNMFADLKRSENNENVIEIKIVPAAMAETVAVPLYREIDRGGHSQHGGTSIQVIKDNYCYLTMPAVTANEEEKKNKGYFGQHEDYTYTPHTIQDMLSGDAVKTKVDKPQRIEVFFVDDAKQDGSEFPYGGRNVDVQAPSPFTAYDLKNIKQINHSPWSLSLNMQNEGVMSMFTLHGNSYVKQMQRYSINFLSQKIPSANDIYFINNKIFKALNIEITIKDGDILPLMSGTFVEIK